VPKDRRNRIVLWGVVGSLLSAIVVIALFITMVSSGNDKWQEMEISVDRLSREVTAWKGIRALPQRKSVPGSAWDDYSLALAEVAAVGKHHSQLAAFVDRGVHRPEVEKIVVERTAAFELLHKGAQRADGAYPYQWQQGPMMEIPSLLEIRTLVNLGVAKARFLLEAGRAREAADLIVDVLVFSGDVGRNGPLLMHLIGISTYHAALNEAHSLVISNKLTPTELADFASRLEALDREFPRLGPAFVSEAFAFGMGALEDGDTPSPQRVLARARALGLRTGLSSRSVAADAFAELHGYMRRAESVDRAAFATASREAAAIEAEAGRSKNPELLVPSVSKSFQRHHEVLARLRLVRAAAAFRATGELPDLDDPFGGKLLHTIENGKVKVWSVGPDGKDDGGLGFWSGSEFKDIVLEIPK
jgi:hypothetical protein